MRSWTKPSAVPLSWLAIPLVAICRWRWRSKILIGSPDWAWWVRDLASGTRTTREQWNDSVRTLAAERDLPEGMEVISMHVDAMVMDRMSEIQVPATVIVGERDKRFMASADVFEKYLNVSGRTVVPGAGHMVHVKGAPGVAAALRASFG